MQEKSFQKPLLPSSQIKHQDSNQSSDSDFEDKCTVGKKKKRAIIKYKQGRDGRCKETNSSTSSENEDKNVTSLLLGKNFQQIFSQYYQMTKNIHISYNHTANRIQKPLRVPQNLLSVQVLE